MQEEWRRVHKERDDNESNGECVPSETESR